MERKFYEELGYTQWIEDSGKMNCSCPDFEFRKLKKEKINPNDAVYKVKQEGVCKHLAWIILWEYQKRGKELFANSKITDVKIAEAMAKIKDLISKSSRSTK